jgi:hypothetical protein
MAKGERESRGGDFGFGEFALRWVASLVLVFATYNPSGYSYVHWIRSTLSEGGLGALHFFVGAILLACWAVLVVATKNSLGVLGTVIGALLVGTALWLLVDLGLVDASRRETVVWLGLVALGTLLAIGLSWAHVWRRLSGQLEVDDNDG